MFTDRRVSRLRLQVENKRHPPILPLLLVFFLLFCLYPVSALTQTRDFAVSTSTVQTAPVTLGSGIKGSSLGSPTGGYAAVNATAGLTFYENSSAPTSVPSEIPFAIDGGNIRETFQRRTSGTTNSWSTTYTNDLLYLIVSVQGTNQVSSVTSSPTRTWTRRAAISAGTTVRVETWYAISSAVFLGTITVTFDSDTSFMVLAFGISGANLANPFDASSAVPALGAGTGNSQSVTISTSNANDFIIGAIATSKPPKPSAGSGFILIGSAFMKALGGAGEYKIVTTAQSYAVNFSTIDLNVNWGLIGDAVQGNPTLPVPSVVTDTTLSTPASSGSFTIAAGYTAYLWSPMYSSTTTVIDGSWLLDLWASATSRGMLNVIFQVVDSSANVVASAGSGMTGTIGTSKSEVKTMFSCSQVTVPSGGHLLMELANPLGSGRTFTIYWGTRQLTNFQTPGDYNYFLTIKNPGTASFSVSLSTYSSSSISRLTNMTVAVYTSGGASTKEIIIVNGMSTQSSGPAVILPSNSTLYLRLFATANAFGSSRIVLLMKFSPSTKPFTYDVISLKVN